MSHSVAPAKAVAHNHECAWLQSNERPDSLLQPGLVVMGPGLRRDDDVERAAPGSNPQRNCDTLHHTINPPPRQASARLVRGQDMRKVDWARVGRVTEPGRYMMRFGYVIVTAD